MNTDQIANILTYVLIFMIMLLFSLIIVYVVLKMKNNSLPRKNVENGKSKNNTNDTNTLNDKQSVLNFMEFDKIEDNMIIRDNGKRYVMVLKCKGINYDLMSNMEKISVEEGFIQFLNTLRHPIQLYIQTRTINMTDSINNYTKKVTEIQDKLFKMKQEYNKMVESENYTREELGKYFYEVTKQTNLYEYGRDILENTKRMSFNRNILVNSYYIVIPYMPEEVNSDKYDREEIKSIAFSELYTRAQSIISTIYSSGITAKIMDSNELSELLYVAYNRDESEVFGIDKALKAGYAELYSTSQDVLDKKMKELDKIIKENAVKLANEKINEAKSEKQIKIEETEENIDDLIDELAISFINDNKKYIDKDIIENAKEKIKNKEGENKNGKTTKKRTRSNSKQQE